MMLIEHSRALVTGTLTEEDSQQYINTVIAALLLPMNRAGKIITPYRKVFPIPSIQHHNVLWPAGEVHAITNRLTLPAA